MNPVQARLVERAEDRCWSSDAVHLAKLDDDPRERRAGRFANLIEPELSAEALSALWETIGPPLGFRGFLYRLAPLPGHTPCRTPPA